MYGMNIEPLGIMKQVVSPESAAAADIFDQFANAQTFKSVQGTFRLLCDTLRLKPTNFPNFYPKLKAKLRSWKAQALWSKFEKRANHRCYNRGKACANVKVLIIGAGPCGLRAAIEAQLLGAKVVVIEKRDRFSRNNVLHLWPFVIQDLRNLGAKKFYGKFCAGAIDHISIRQLQCVLLKVALLLGVEVHENVAFDEVIEPPTDQSREKIGWKALVTPRDHPLSQYEFDVLIGADGKRNTLKGFKRKEFRGKLAIAITANFINRHSEAEARVQEISGVAFIFNQKFFTDLRDHMGIDLENIVYYKDETHYFVMTAKKYSLIEKGVILNDYADTARLLAPENVSKEALFNYAREAADFSTNFQMPNLDFAVNHYGQEDVAMFDFTSMYAAESACRVIERKGHRLLQALVGDSLLEPFWPTGSGCARGFLSSMDACWMIRSWSLGTITPLQVLAERESIYRLLAQTTPENLSKDYNEYSLNPASRYPNLNSNAVRPTQVRPLYDTDGEVKEEAVDILEMPKKRRKRDSLVHPDTLLNWCQRQVILYKNVNINNMTSSWKNGLALAAIVHRYRPDLIDFNSLAEDDGEKNNQQLFDICEREFGINPVMTAKEMSESQAPDALAMVSYVSQIYETFRGEIPHISRAPMVDFSPEDRPQSPLRKSPVARLSYLSRLSGSKKRFSLERSERGRGHTGTMTEQEIKELERERADLLRRLKKRRSLERDRALFIMNKDAQQATQTGYKKTTPTIKDRENFTSKVKDLEEKLYGVGRQQGVASTSPNAPRVIGKLDRGDWNVRMLEEKLKGQKPNVKKERQDVPKWNRDMFEDKLRVMDQRGKGEFPVEPAKYSAFDVRLQMLDKKLKEGNNLDVGQRGSNKVSAVAGQLASILDTNPTAQSFQRTTTSETCHFCDKRVYLMERQSAQNKFFHRSCFKCECCGVALHLSNYGLATTGAYNGKFLCLHHFGMRNPPRRQSDGKKSAGETTPTRTSAKTTAMTPTSLDLPDVCSNKTRGVTPERVEFENTIEFTSEEELLSEIDEDEWTDRNFGMSANEYESSDEESDFSSDEMASENEELEEAFQNSLTADETWKLAETWKRRYFQRRTSAGEDDDDGEVTDEEEDDDDDDDEDDYDESDEEYSYEEYENEDDEDESTATEGELQDGAGEGPSERVAVTPEECGAKTEDVCLIIPQQHQQHQQHQQAATNKVGQVTDYQALKSSGTEETGSDGVGSEEYTDTDTETESDVTTEDADDEEDIRKRSSRSDRRQHQLQQRRKRCSAPIPTIVIDETTTKAPDEEDDAYFVTLHEQSLRAERTLEDLIVQNQSKSPLESAVQTPDEPHWIQEDIRPLVASHCGPDAKTTSDVTVVANDVEDGTKTDQLGKDPRPASTDRERRRHSPSPSSSTSLRSLDKCSSASDVTAVSKTAPDDSKKSSSQEGTVTVAVAATESPTAKMMLKLKEQYLLGNADTCQQMQQPMSMGSFPVTSYDLEPTVKSCLELISEKQRMLTPAPSPSSTLNLRLAVSSGVSGDTQPSSSASASSPPPPPLGSSSSWSEISPMSQLGTTSDSMPQSPTTKLEMRVQIGPGLVEDESIAPQSSSTTVTPLNDQLQPTSFTSPTPAKTDDDVDDVQDGDDELTMNVGTPTLSATDSKLSVKYDKTTTETKVDYSSTDETVPAEVTTDELSSACDYEHDDSFFDKIDSSNVTLRKRSSSKSSNKSLQDGSRHGRTEIIDDQRTDLGDQCTIEDHQCIKPDDQCKRDKDRFTIGNQFQKKGQLKGYEDQAMDHEDQLISQDTQTQSPKYQSLAHEAILPTNEDQERRLLNLKKRSIDNCNEQLLTPKDKSESLEQQSTVLEAQVQVPQEQSKVPEEQSTGFQNDILSPEDQLANCEDHLQNPENQWINHEEKITNTERIELKSEMDVSTDMPETSRYMSIPSSESTGILQTIIVPSTSKKLDGILSEGESKDVNSQDITTVLEKTKSNGLLVAEEKPMSNLAKPEDDDSLMGMSNSSDSDAIPCLDERMYNDEASEPSVKVSPKVSGYVGFSERVFPFGAHGVRDSLCLHKTDPKRPSVMSFGSPTNKEGTESMKASQGAMSEATPKPTTAKPSPESLEEIPFADDESTHDSSSTSPDKRDRFIVEHRKFRRSLQRPLSMVETLLGSSSSPVASPASSRSPTRHMLPDTPFTNANMYNNTPKTMKEAVDDLRQMKTVERERARKEARERARLKSDEELGLNKIDYTVLKKKYQKPDGKPDLDLNIQEESGTQRSASASVSASSHVGDEICIAEDSRIDTSTSQQLPGGPSSSSPDSEVFEQDIDPNAVSDMRHQETNAMPLASPDTNSIGSASNDVSSASVSASASASADAGNGNVRSMSMDTNTSSNSTTSKTDHPSSYLEIDLSNNEETNLKTATARAGAKVAGSYGKDVVMTPATTPVSGSISKKDKQKRKSFLSLFSNFGKAKEKDERKSKEKSPSPPSAACDNATLSATQPLSPLEGNGLKVDGTPKESRFHKLRLARSKEKVKSKESLSQSTSSSKEGSCSPPNSTDASATTLMTTASVATSTATTSITTTATMGLTFDKRPQTLTIQSGDITLDRHALIASMASLSRQIHRPDKILGNGGAAKDDSITELDANNVEDASQCSATENAKRAKEIVDDRRKKFQKIAQRVYRQQEQKRLRAAQEIQRQLEELEANQREMETRGVQVEKALRGEGDSAKKDETELMQEWFQLIHAKNVLVRQEQELMVKAKELELEDRHSRLQHQLHERMAVDDLKKTPAEIEEEGQILTEMLEIVEQRDSLIALLEENRQRHQEEDKELAQSMQEKGFEFLSPRPQT